MKSIKGKLVRFLVVALVAYAVLLGYLYLNQSNMIYFPTSAVGASNLDRVWLDQSGPGFVDTPGTEIWMVNPGQANAVLYFGGNAENVVYFAEDVAQIQPDATWYLTSYRGYAGSAGHPSEVGLVADGINLFQTIRAKHENIALVGRSLGSGVASAVSAQTEPHCISLITPFDSLAAVAQTHYPWVPVRWLMQDQYNSAKHLEAREVPIQVIMAGRDRVIPTEHTLALADSIDADQLHWVAIDQANHNDLSLYEAFHDQLGSFLTTQCDAAL